MAGMDDNVPMIGDWLPQNLCPTSLFSNLMAEECSSRLISDVSSQKSCGGSLQESRGQGIVLNAKNKDCEPGIQVSKELAIELDSFNVPKSSTRGGFSERIAGRAGFGNLTLDTSQIRTTRSFSSPTTDFRSPLLTIPPGLSPTMLLDSPIFLSSSLAELSPTTGKFPFMECDNVTGSAVSCKTRDHSPDNVDPTPFAFKLPLAYFPSAEKMPALGIHHQHFLPNSVEHPQQPNFQQGFPQLTKEKDSGGSIAEKKASSANISSGRAPLLDDIQGEADPKGEITSASLGAPAEDGYNWRKYGQKQVKGSEYPRSYYKCTQPNCQVKKKVERSHEGHITEIIYKGAHSHDKPAPNRRSAIPSSHPANGLQIGGSEQIGTAGHDWKNDGLDANQSALVAIEQCDQSYPVQAHDGPYHETPDGVDASSTLSNDEDEDEQVTHGSASRSLDGDGDETESKRRKLDACALEMSAASRAVREPRVVVQTTSDVDILDDGYRWRKYGQKVVKGNPNPRSYYKCTSAGCTVRKHVERASHDLKSVITTYEGKHNHEVPAARTGSQASSAAASCITATASPSSCLPQRKAESARMPDSLGLGRFDGPASVGSFGLPNRDQQLGAAVPNFSFAMAHQGLTHNFAMAGLGPISSLKMPVLPPLPAYMAHYRQLSRAGFMIPKAVPKEEPAADSGLPISGGSSVYQSLMRMPLEPQL